MTKNLDIIEEYDILDLIEVPHLSYIGELLADRKKVARDVLSLKVNDVLLIDKGGFYIDSVFAGLDEKKIEYFVKYTPIEYKKCIIRIFKDQEMMDGVWEIVKSLDDDEGDGLNKNQDRIKKVIQYIQDNRAVFQF